jgi:septal ring-binding cell division protein DamX
MRPQGFGQGAAGLEDLGWNDMGFEPPKPTEAARDTAHDAFGDDVVEHPRAVHPTGLTPVQSPVHTQHAEIADRFAVESPEDNDEAEEVSEVSEVAEFADVEEIAEVVEVVPAPMPAPAPVQAVAPRREPRSRAAPGGKAKAAFTLRLDPDRHLKLRLACAVNGQSAQQLVTQALDQLLDAMPELEAMAQKAKPKG